RWAEAEIPLGDGRTARPGDKVVIDLMAVNRDPAVFGADGGEFNPERKLPDGVAPYGLSFGTGMHACIGQDLSGGLVPDPDGTAAGEHLYGLVAVAVQAMFDRGVAPDPDDPPAIDTTTARPYWARSPVRFLRPRRRRPPGTGSAGQAGQSGEEAGQ